MSYMTFTEKQYTHKHNCMCVYVCRCRVVVFCMSDEHCVKNGEVETRCRNQPTLIEKHQGCRQA